jgi:hypothetical protein
LANVSAFHPAQRGSDQTDEVHMNQMRRAFTLVILMFMFTGLTVHFWNYMLMFWGICLGIRASLREPDGRAFQQAQLPNWTGQAIRIYRP